MTFSLLTLDRSTGQLGGVSATGNLCVGGWVLRGDAACGLSASHGAKPSVMWGEDVLAGMKRGVSATQAVSEVTAPIRGVTGGSWRRWTRTVAAVSSAVARMAPWSSI